MKRQVFLCLLVVLFGGCDGKISEGGIPEESAGVVELAKSQTLKGHRLWFAFAVWSPDGTMLARGDGDAVRVWAAVSGKEIYRLKGHEAEVGVVAWSPDGTRLASCSADKTAKVWDARSSKEIHTLKCHSSLESPVAWSPDGTKLASGSKGMNERLRPGIVFIHEMQRRGLWNPSIYDNTVRVWDADSGKEIHTLKGHWDVVRSVAWSPDGSKLASSGADGTVRVWDSASGKAMHVLEGYVEHGGNMRVGWSLDGTGLVSGGWVYRVAVWDAMSGKELHKLGTNLYLAGEVAYSPDLTKVAVRVRDRYGDGNTNLRVWDVASGKELRKFKGHESYVGDGAWSPDGDRLASRGLGGRVRVWDIANGTELHGFQDHESTVYRVAWSPDGTKLAISSVGAIKIWSIPR